MPGVILLVSHRLEIQSQDSRLQVAGLFYHTVLMVAKRAILE